MWCSATIVIYIHAYAYHVRVTIYIYIYQITKFNEAKAALQSTKKSFNLLQTGSDSRDPTWHSAAKQEKLLRDANEAVKSYKMAKDNIKRSAYM